MHADFRFGLPTVEAVIVPAMQVVYSVIVAMKSTLGSRQAGTFRYRLAGKTFSSRPRRMDPSVGVRRQRRGAVLAQHAGTAARLLRVADLPAVLDEQVREHRPALTRKEGDQRLLDLHRIVER